MTFHLGRQREAQTLLIQSLAVLQARDAQADLVWTLIYLAVVCVLPEVLISYAAVPFYFGGTSLLIAVSVTMDTVAQVQSHLLAHQYEGLIKKAKLRGATRGRR